MLPAAVHVQMPVGLAVKQPPNVVSKPTGMLNPVMAAVPLMLKYGPEGVMALAAEATVPVWTQLAGFESGLRQPGAQVSVNAEQVH